MDGKNNLYFTPGWLFGRSIGRIRRRDAVLLAKRFAVYVQNCGVGIGDLIGDKRMFRAEICSPRVENGRASRLKILQIRKKENKASKRAKKRCRSWS